MELWLGEVELWLGEVLISFLLFASGKLSLEGWTDKPQIVITRVSAVRGNCAIQIYLGNERSRMHDWTESHPLGSGGAASSSSGLSPSRLLPSEPARFLGVFLLNILLVLSRGEFFLMDLAIFCAAKVNTLADSGGEGSLDWSPDLPEWAGSSRASLSRRLERGVDVGEGSE